MSQAKLLSCAVLALAALPARSQTENRIYTLLRNERERLVAIEKDPATTADALAQAKARRERIAAVLYEPDKYRIEVGLGEVVAEANQPPELRVTAWRLDQEYWYPASSIKLCAAVAALEQLNEIKRKTEPAASEATALAFHPLEKDQPMIEADPANVEGGTLTLATLIREALVVSDNNAYNRLYDFCGQEWLNQRMWRAGLKSSRLSHRLTDDGSPSVQREKSPLQRTKPAIELRLPEHKTLVGAQYSTLNLEPSNDATFYVGRAFMDGKERVRGGFSFYYKNAIWLADLQKCLVRVVRPDIALPGEPFDLTDAQRALLMEALSMYPGDSKNPLWPRDKFADESNKYFLPGLARVVPKEHLKVYDKIGEAYGFATDNAYIVDTRSNRAFFLAATVWSDSDGVLNDGKYDYATFSEPLLADIAELVARDVWGVPIVAK